jgi:hypothetical protein
MTAVRKLKPRGVGVDEDGYVTMSVDAWGYYALLFNAHGIDVNEAMDTLDAFDAAVARCSSSAKVYQLRTA